MKKLTLALLCAFLPLAALASGVSGIPANPKFATVTTTGTATIGGAAALNGGATTTTLTTTGTITTPTLNASGTGTFSTVVTTNNTHTNTLTVDGASTLSGDALFGGATTIANVDLYASGAALNEKIWRFKSSAGTFYLCAEDDAKASCGVALQYTRSGTTPRTLSINGALTSGKTCATNYTRDNPNYCRRTQTGVSLASLTRDICTAVAIPPGATAYVDVYLKVVAMSGNASAGGRQTTVRAFSDASCGTYPPEAEVQASGWEFSAVNLAVLSEVTQVISAPIVAGNVYLEMVDGTENTGQGYYAFAGYGD